MVIIIVLISLYLVCSGCDISYWKRPGGSEMPTEKVPTLPESSSSVVPGDATGQQYFSHIVPPFVSYKVAPH